MLQPVKVHGIVPALIVNASILMPCHVYVPVLVQPLPALHAMQHQALSQQEQAHADQRSLMFLSGALMRLIAARRLTHNTGELTAQSSLKVKSRAHRAKKLIFETQGRCAMVKD